MTKEHMTGQENKVIQAKSKASPKVAEKAAPDLQQQAMTPGLATVLQQTMGNQAIGRLVGRNRKPIQAQMSLNAVNDPYEQEADSVAQQVVGQLNNPIQRQDDEDEIMTQRIQRQEDEDEVMAKSIQRQEDEDEIMAKSVSSPQSLASSSEGSEVATDVESRIQQAQGGGQPLGDGVRQPMEQAFGADFSNVHIHTNSEADNLNQSIQARAFTTGQDIFFKEGEYSPGNSIGQELLAHELTHVVQQNHKIARQSQAPESTIINMPAITITGDPHFYTKALRVNQFYAKNPPFPGWPYDDGLRQLWEQNTFDDFADRVRDIQEQELGLSGKNVDGILGPMTTKKIAGSKEDPGKKDSKVSNNDEIKPNNSKQSNQIENSNNEISVRADLGPKNRRRAFMLDWDKKHQEIAQSESLREVFEANLLLQLSEQFGSQVTQSEILQRIAQAEAETNIEVAESMRIKLRIANQYAVIATLKVDESSRYQRTATSTYCNIYAYDVVTALGGYLPRVWWTASALKQIQKGEDVQPKYGKTVREMNANALTDWMYKYGDVFGWRQEDDISEAQAEANNGKLVILLAVNKNPRKSGHVNVLVAETEQHQAERDENGNVDKPLQSQAGATNFQVRAHQQKWWQDNRHKLGAAWVFEGEPNSPLLTPDELGSSSIN